jgi:hypothetical protein
MSLESSLWNMYMRIFTNILVFSIFNRLDVIYGVSKYARKNLNIVSQKILQIFCSWIIILLFSILCHLSLLKKIETVSEIFSLFSQNILSGFQKEILSSSNKYSQLFL